MRTERLPCKDAQHVQILGYDCLIHDSIRDLCFISKSRMAIPNSSFLIPHCKSTTFFTIFLSLPQNSITLISYLLSFILKRRQAHSPLNKTRASHAENSYLFAAGSRAPAAQRGRHRRNYRTPATHRQLPHEHMGSAQGYDRENLPRCGEAAPTPCSAARRS